uniref:ABC transporter domain-containing protein n=1 Tax=Angiostrongylus cantonensis TaxID=6313 RepID=A0A0K0DJL5_ANGCA
LGDLARGRISPLYIAVRHPGTPRSHNEATGRVLLDNVSGFAKPGQLMALMGASGSGKTTLLNTLLARNLKGLEVEGTVEVNGNEVGRQISAISGYAQQEELFIGTLTVREYLSIQAVLRTNLSKKGRELRVGAILSKLGLTKCQNTRIGVVGIRKGISGGEARRLTFACEMLSNPALLFCDEPTTGLDSFMAENVVTVLSKLAKGGRTIVCTMHQPASQLFLMFDRVMLLAGGHTAFFGTPRECIKFFEECGYPCPRNYNPADLLIHTLAIVPNEEEACRIRVTQICDAFENGSYGKALIREIASIPLSKVPDGRRQIHFFTQVAALLHRHCLDNLRNPALARAKFLQKAVLGLFIGLLYFQTPLTIIGVGNVNGALFYIVCELTYSTLFGILACIPSDHPLVIREYHDGLYNVISYYLARIMSYMPLFSLDGLVMLYVCYWMVGFSSSLSQVLLASLISLLTEQSATACGVMIGSISPSYPVPIVVTFHVAASLAGPLLTLLSLTGGLYANVGSLPVYISWIQYFSWFRYGFELFAINQWEEVNNSTIWGPKYRDEVLSQLSFKSDRFALDLILITAFIFGFYVIGYVGLLIRVYRAR